ncbi:hypothetical protein [Actinoplanes sp. NPDC048796]|uniref:hypothetical protein n=1 Tax=Actinoplanes sp. NPDC048796 TaxID=3155640 RepID=UPI0033DC175E
MPRTAGDLTPNVRVAAQATNHHMGCAEIGGLCEIEKQGAAIAGARAGAVKVANGEKWTLEEHGEPWEFYEACESLFCYLDCGPLK